MQEFSNAHFERADALPNFRPSRAAVSIATTLDLRADRVAQIMISRGADVPLSTLRTFEIMRADHLEILRLLFLGNSLSQTAFVISRTFNVYCTRNVVMGVRRDHFEDFRAAIISGQLSISQLAGQPVIAGQSSRKNKGGPLPKYSDRSLALNKRHKNKLARGGQISAGQPAKVAEISATQSAAFDVPARIAHLAITPASRQPAMAGQSAGSGQL